MNRLILCVDDEKIILNSLEDQLRQILDREDILEFAESAEEALEVLEHYHKEDNITPSIIVCDQIMPRMKGDEFLEIVYQKYPKCFKILLTGQAEKENIKNAINKAKLNKFLTKPWLKDDLNTIVVDALLTQELQLEVESKTQELFELNKDLERKIKERTTELSIKNNLLNDSINYAKRIQSGTLPDINKYKKNYEGIFVILKPLEGLSGDFYFISEQYDNKLITAALDCTGHGIPAALMSMLAHSILNTIINIHGITSPSMILNLLHKGIVDILKQESSGIEEGMDAAICVFDKSQNHLQFAGAHSSLIYFDENELIYERGCKFPVGGLINYNRDYITVDIPIKPGMQFYLFSDGFPDQFGGPDDKKFTKKRVKTLLQEVHTKNFSDQKKEIEAVLSDWQGKTQQTDDILVMGFEFKTTQEIVKKKPSMALQY